MKQLTAADELEFNSWPLDKKLIALGMILKFFEEDNDEFFEWFVDSKYRVEDRIRGHGDLT